ncbi:MAG: phosphate ABC transporter substrate-binding protein [Magnetococcus sp. DMHC-6]
MASLLLFLPSIAIQAENQENMIRIKGSDTMLQAILSLGESFSTLQYPKKIRILVTGGGSGNGIAALLNGHTDIASTSRALTPQEEQMALKRFKKIPVDHVVALDAVTVFVHPSNPLRVISVENLAKIFGKNSPFRSWIQFAQAVPGCMNQEIVRISRKNNSGTYGFFRESLLGDQSQFVADLLTVEHSSDVVDQVAKSPCAIGYSSMAQENGQPVKTLCISTNGSLESACLYPIASTIYNHAYPFARSLHMYTLGTPSGLVQQFLDWVNSSQGRKIFGQAGFVSIPN